MDPDDPPPQVRLNDQIQARLRKLLGLVVMFVLVMAVIVLGELLPPFPALEAYLSSHPTLGGWLVVVTGSIAFLGVLLLTGTQFIVRVGDEHVSRSRSRNLVEDELKQGGWFRRRISGWSITGGFYDEATIWEVKRAFQRGIWWRKPRWRRFTLMMLGATLVLFGVWGTIFIVSPAGIKLLAALIVLYAVVRTAWAFYAVKPPGTH